MTELPHSPTIGARAETARAARHPYRLSVHMDADSNLALGQLLAQAALRDQRAFAKLYQAASPQLFAVALRILRRRDWAEEVLQECFVNIWNHAGNYSASKAAPMTWMTSIVRNRCLDWLRRPQLEDQAKDDEVFDNIADERLTPLERLLEHAESTKLYHCLQRLSGPERQSITAAFIHGLTHSELAAQLRLPLGTIKSHVRRGLQRLKGCLEL